MEIDAVEIMVVCGGLAMEARAGGCCKWEWRLCLDCRSLCAWVFNDLGLESNMLWAIGIANGEG
jgi:hypothetical protein